MRRAWRALTEPGYGARFRRQDKLAAALRAWRAGRAAARRTP